VDTYLFVRTLGGLLALLMAIVGAISVLLLWLPPSAPYFRRRNG